MSDNAREDVTRLTDVLERQREEERERAVRALLMRPLLAEGHPDLTLVRRHAEYLREWFAREAGWTLRVERGCARLYKRPASLDDATRGLPGFDRDRYVLLCLACAVLERADLQITLRALGERLLEAFVDPELEARGFSFTFEPLRERRALVQVCRYLIELGALARIAGDEEAYVNRSGDVLYDINRRVLAALPASTRGASWLAALEASGQETSGQEASGQEASGEQASGEQATGEQARGEEAIGNPGEEASEKPMNARLAALVEEYIPDSAEGRRAAARHRIARRLLDDPVLYHDELTEEERQYLATQRGPMSARLAQGAGLAAELRSEGIALVDRDGELTDEQMPSVGTEGHATLLVAEHLAEAARGAPADEPRLHSLAEIGAFVREAADRYGRYWRKAAREPGAEAELARVAVERLERLKLVRRVGDAVAARPALFRFAVAEAQVPAQQALM